MNLDALVLRDVSEAVCTLTLNRPKAYNALSLELMSTLIAELRSAADSKDIKVIVIRGAGRGFCAGHDLKELTGEEDPALQQQTFATCSALMQQVSAVPQPVIAQIHGIATAAGCQLVASCDLAIAAEDARFATPGVNIGLFCSTPMVALTRTIAPKHAMEMLMLGDMIDAHRAYQIGLINRVVPGAELDQSVRSMALKLASKSALTLRTGKQAFYQQLDQSVASAYDHCSSVMCCNLDSNDAKEGIDAFLNKREPTWSDS